jgi:tetratricopeptide (TPR) repeat protein
VKIAMGDAKTAAALLSGTKPGTSVRRACSLLKREYRLSLVTGEEGRYLRAALAAAKASKSPELRSLAAAALLSAGRVNEARAMLGPIAGGSSAGKTEKIALAVRFGGASGMDGADGLSLPPEYWEGLARETGRPGFRLDAALCSLATGDKKNAVIGLRVALASGLKIPPQLAYECGLYQDCLRIIQGMERSGGAAGADLLLLAADARYLIGEADRAQALWRKAMADYPAAASACLHNLAASESDTHERETILLRGIELYPKDEQLSLDLADFYAIQGRGEEGLALLDRLAAGTEADARAVVDDPGTLLVRLKLGAIGAESARSEARILEAVWAHPEDRSLARFAFFKLLGLKRHEAAFRILLDRERNESEADWLPFGRACLLAASGDRSGAVAAFDACGDKAVHYASAWNAAVLLARGRDWNGARKRLAGAIAAAKGSREKALAYVFLGDCLRSQGSSGAARSAYAAALAAWPECAEAGLALANLMNDRN